MSKVLRSQQTRDLDLGVLLGCLLGVTAASLIGAGVGSSINSQNLIYDYQALLGSVLAVGGAALSVRMIWRQIEQAQLQHKENIERSGNAARAVLPLSLSRLSTYAEDSVAILLTMYEPNKSHQGGFVFNLPEQVPGMPMLPDDVVLVLKENVEFGNEAAVITISHLIRHLQIQHSRLAHALERLRSGDRRGLDLRVHIEELIVDALEVYARCASLYGYARRELIDEYPAADPSQDKLLSAANNCGLWRSYEGITQLIERCYPVA